MAAPKGQIPWNKGKTNVYSEKTLYRMRKSRFNTIGGGRRYWRKETLLRDNYTCQVCGIRDLEIMEVDHIKPICKYPELKFILSNLITLCPNCHTRKTIREKKNK